MVEPTQPPPLVLYVESVAFWSPRIPTWESAVAAFAGTRAPLDSPVSKPSPAVLAATERRRAPDTVALALEVAQQACRNAGREPSELNSIFASTHGDLVISDYMCATLATNPELVSPTKFHNSVHNAAAGYWSIGTGSHTPYTAICAYEATFATGLLEAATQAHCGERPVLLVTYDIEGRGPMATMAQSRGLFATALVLNAVARDGGRKLTLRIRTGDGGPTAPRASAVVECIHGSALESSLPFFESLGETRSSRVTLHLASSLLLDIDIDPSKGTHGS